MRTGSIRPRSKVASSSLLCCKGRNHGTVIYLVNLEEHDFYRLYIDLLDKTSRDFISADTTEIQDIISDFSIQSYDQIVVKFPPKKMNVILPGD